MNRERLEEMGEKLQLSAEDITAIRKRKLRETLFAPVAGGIFMGLSFLLGWFLGRGDERKESGYPFSVRGYCTCGWGMLVSFSMGLVVFRTVMRQARLDRTEGKEGWKKLQTLGIFTLTGTVLLSAIIFYTTYKHFQPDVYYSETIDYGVYSQEEKP